MSAELPGPNPSDFLKPVPPHIEAVHWLMSQVSTSESIGEVRRWAQG